jgi:BlaI family penicillinase repressor
MERWKRLPDSELEVMLIIWDGKEKVSTSDIMQHLKEKKSVQLVQNALNRLEGKGFVQCEKIGRLNHYTPLVSLDEYREKETSSFLEKMYQSSGSKLFAALIENDALSEDDIQKIKALLEKGKE